MITDRCRIRNDCGSRNWNWTWTPGDTLKVGSPISIRNKCTKIGYIKKLKNLWEWKTFGVRWAKGRVDQAKVAGSGAASYSCQKNCCLNREIINFPVRMYRRTSFSKVMRRWRKIQRCGSGMYSIPIPDPNFLHPGSSKSLGIFVN